MCKTKSSTAAIDPTRSRSNSSSKPMAGPTRRISGDQYATTATTSTATGASSYKDSWQSSSLSSVASLSSARESLPENPHIFNFSEICSATNNFLAKKLSSSSSSATWRCVIRGNDVVVVQRKFRRLVQTEELRDRLSSVCRSHHASLIKLRGASVSGNYIYLVYDYIHGATLADCLRGSKNSNFTVLSTWMSRVQVASDLAHGLDYIHNSTGSSSRFVHNHIKSSSVIVTEPGLHSKICHFGTAKLCGEVADGAGADAKFEGTRGYMSPEFRITGVSTQKSDVYAFGVVVLEILSGEEPLKYKADDAGGGYRRISVVETAREAVEGSGVLLRRWIDRRLKDSYPITVAEKMVRVGLDCVKEDPDKRPDMGLVVGQISRLYLDSMNWSDTMGAAIDYSVSLAPR